MEIVQSKIFLFIKFYQLNNINLIIYFKKIYKKKYQNLEEDARRRHLYAQSKTLVNEHNKKFVQSEVAYKIGINEFADWTLDERRKFLGFKPDSRPDLLDSPDICACEQILNYF